MSWTPDMSQHLKREIQWYIDTYPQNRICSSLLSRFDGDMRGVPF